jgi:ATP-binding cassette subfamily F protein 3
MSLLEIRGLGKHYGPKTLFEQVDLNLVDRQRVALLGANGSGKSTLIRIILGQETQDQGELRLKRHLRIGHLAQELHTSGTRTLREEVMKLDGRREEILLAKKDCEEQMALRQDETILKEYARILEEYDRLDEYRLPARTERILEGMGFQPSDFDRPLSEFSGGWLMRAALARILLLGPDLLILDEPTNHLDLESLLWLEEFLQDYPGCVLLVSHDRAFLNRLVDTVWEIDHGEIRAYSGDLDDFLVQKEERLRMLEAQRAGQDARIAELKAFVERFGAKATKARQAQSRMKQIEKLESNRVEIAGPNREVGFGFPPCPPSGKEVLTLSAAGIEFPGKKLFSRLDWIIQRGSRTAIVGANGAGKTTLLRALSGLLPPTSGTIRRGHGVQLGFYSQLQAETLDFNKTILQELESAAPTLELSRIRGIAGAFLFSGDDIHKSIRILSGGEKARVALARLLLTPHNFLLLDEPTNHLDAASRAVLLDALLEYDGTLCLISHDRDFVAPLADRLLEMTGREAIPLVQNYEEYVLRKTREAKERLRPPAPPASSSEPREETKTSRPSNNQVQSWRKELTEREHRISQLEVRLNEINDRLATGELSEDPHGLRNLIEEQTRAQAELDACFERWAELGHLLEGL